MLSNDKAPIHPMENSKLEDEEHFVVRFKHLVPRLRRDPCRDAEKVQPTKRFLGLLLSPGWKEAGQE